ncbi:MAG: YbaB/EbfC family nucleoid-associated protein [Planctomycetota bacterium]
MLEKLADLQQRAQKVKDALAGLRIEAQRGGVTITITGAQRVVSISVDPAACQAPAELEADLLASINEAIQVSQKLAAEEMRTVMEEMELGGSSH